MAAGGSIGALVVRLGLDASEYVAGLSKSEYQAQKFAQNTRRAIAEVAKVLGGLEVARQVYENTKAIIEQAASLNDLADATGSTVENLSRLSNQAKIAGTDFQTLQGLVLKLSAGMAGADDESSKVGAALKYLGVTTRDPAQALQEIAVKLNTYADGVGKAGLAVALFGKQGPAFLATLKDIAELQDVGATVSAKQAQEAEALQKELARLTVESRGFANIILNDVVPGLTQMIREIRESTVVAGGLFNAFRLFSGLDLSNPAKKIDEITKNIAWLEGQKTTGGLFSDFNNRFVQGQIDDAKKQLEYAKLVLAQRQPGPRSFRNADREVAALTKPQVDFRVPKEDKGTREAISEAQRYLEALEKQLQATFELSEVEKAEVAIFDMRAKGVAGLTPVIEAQIRDYATQIQFSKDAADAEKKRLQVEQEAARIRERISQETTRQIEQEQREAQNIREQNEQLREQLIFLKSGEDGLRSYTDAKLAKAIAEKEDQAAMLQNAGAAQAVIDAVRQQAAALRERQDILAKTKIAEQLKREADAIRYAQEQIFDIGANALADFVDGTKSAKDALRSFLSDLQRFLTAQAFQTIKGSLFGGQGAGLDIFSLLFKNVNFGSLFGGFGGFGGGGGIPGIGFSGGGFGEHFASGGISRGGLALVGEHGPEIVNLRRGQQVYSAPDSKRMFGRPGHEYTVPITINAYGKQDTKSLRQIRAHARDGVMAGIRDR